MKQGIYLATILFQVIGFQKVNLNNSNTRVIQNHTQGPIIYQLEYAKETIIINQTKFSSVIGIELKQSDDKPNNNICTPILNDLVFPDFDTLVETQLIDNINENNIEIPEDHIDPSYFLSFPILVNMVQVNNTIAAVTTDHYLIILDTSTINNTILSSFSLNTLARISFGFLRKSQNQFQTPQILYDRLSDTIYIIYQDQIIRCSVQKMLMDQQAQFINDYLDGTQNIQDEFIGTVKSSNGYLFVPVGYKGLSIYKILQSGEIQLIKSLSAIDLYNNTSKKIYIIDVEIGGSKGEFLYILDRINGIVLLNINDLNNIKNYNSIGKIDIYGGTVIKQWNNTLFVLLEGDINSQVKEIGINMNKNEWYILRTHYLFGHYFDIEVTEKFAILLGLDVHLIIYHSIWEGFQNVYEQKDTKIKQVSKLKEEYLFIPGIQQLLFYTWNEYSNNKEFQKGRKFLMGLTKTGIIDIPYKSSQSYVKCFTDDRYYIGKNLDYELKINTSDCQLQQEDSYYEQMCIYTEKIQVRIVASDVMYFTIEELFSIIIGLVVLLFALSAMIAHLLRNLSKKKQVLEQEIIGFENKGLSVDISFYPQDQQ